MVTKRYAKTATGRTPTPPELQNIPTPKPAAPDASGHMPGRLDYRCVLVDPLDPEPPNPPKQTFQKSLAHVRAWGDAIFPGASHEAYIRVYESREYEIAPIKTTKEPPKEEEVTK